jgi:hypothetical protein
LSVPSLKASGAGLFAVIIVSLSYPFFLALFAPRTGFWRGYLRVIFIALLVSTFDFSAYLISYGALEYAKGYKDFSYFLNVCESNAFESLGFFIPLDLVPVTLAVILNYPFGYLAAWLLVRRLIA